MNRDATKPRRKLWQIAPPLLCCALLAAMMGFDRLSVDHAAAEPFHARVRDAMAASPRQIGKWYGEDVGLPADALTLLKPNAELSRRFQTYNGGAWAELLIVQCKDSRDMLGHYPPNCYPAAGWTIDSGQPRQWKIGALAISGREYEIFRPAPDSTPAATGKTTAPRVVRYAVMDFFVLPDGRTVADMPSVIAASANYQMQAYGVAQVQLLCPADVPESERLARFSDIVGGNLPLLEAMGSGLSSAANSAGAGHRELGDKAESNHGASEQ